MKNWITYLLPLLSGLLAVAAQGAEPLKVCLISGSEEYQSDASLAEFQAYLEASFPARCILLEARAIDDLPGLEALDDCDVALFFTRRLTIGGDQLARVKKYAESGRPLVAVRTASHGFENWPDFDTRILGGHYRGHYRDHLANRSAAVERAGRHPVLDGVRMIASQGSLYKYGPPDTFAGDTSPLLSGNSPEGQELTAWTREARGGRVFYTSIGARGDFENATYRRMLANALFWTARREIVRKPLAPPPQRLKPEGTLRLTLRSRVEEPRGSGTWKEIAQNRDVPVAETAIVICDLWDQHWCRGATERCGAIAERMAPLIRAARAKGVQIVHAPSDCMDFYAETPQRRRAMLAPAVTPPKPLDRPDPPLPIDDSDGGCDTGEDTYLAWTRQDARIDVGEYDAISDNGTEIYNLFQQLGIKTVIVMGVHTNMCVLNRTFAIKRMTRLGMDCVLARDLTDTMYDPKDRPYVSHDEGTELVVQHIEKNWCPSILSNDLLDGLPK